MSGFSSSTECPNCGKECDMYQDRKPFDYISHYCLNCGLLISPVVSYMTLKEINSYRFDSGLPLLKKKPKQNKNIW